MAQGYQGMDPYRFEEVEVSTNYESGPNSKVRLIYNHRPAFQATNGTITNIQTTITVQAPNGQTHTIIRDQNGEYRPDTWWTRVTRRR